MDKCKTCGKEIPYFTGEICQDCTDKRIAEQKSKELETVDERKDLINEIPIVSVYELANNEIIKFFDIISSEVVIGTGVLSEVTANISDIFGTTSDSFEGKLNKAKKIALLRIKRQAKILGANAIIGAKTDYLVTNNNMFMFAISGTPVLLKSIKEIKAHS